MTVYTGTTAAQRLGVTPSRVALWCREGRLPAIKRGAAWIITERDLAAFERIPRWPGRPRKADAPPPRP